MNNTTADYENKTRAYLDNVSRLAYDLNEDRIEEIVSLLDEVTQKGNIIFICGNGGSFLTALHFATDLTKCISDYVPYREKGPTVSPRVRVLGENIGVLTAFSNDIDYAYALSSELENWSDVGDALICISASGESKNILKAAQVAGTRAIHIITLTGKPNNTLDKHADIYINVGTDDTQEAEDIHSIACHAIFRALLQRVKERYP